MFWQFLLLITAISRTALIHCIAMLPVTVLEVYLLHALPVYNDHFLQTSLFFYNTHKDVALPSAAISGLNTLENTVPGRS